VNGVRWAPRSAGETLEWLTFLGRFQKERTGLRPGDVAVSVGRHRLHDPPCPAGLAI
jgi:hypothetical protein